MRLEFNSRIWRVLPALAPATTTTATAATVAATAAAAAATTTVAATAATTAAATEATATTAAAAPAILRLFHGNLAALNVAAVQLLDGLAGLVVRRHLDEPEAARPTGLTIGDDLGVRDSAEAGEQFTEIQLGDAIGQIANIQSRSHFILFQ